MFQALEEVVRSAGKLSLTLRMEGDQMVVVAIPQPEGKVEETALRQPLVLTGTPADLDAGFAETVLSYANARRTLGEQVATTVEILQAAEKTQAGKAQKSLSKTAKAALPAPSKAAASNPDPDGDGEDEVEEDEQGEGESSSANVPSDAGKPAGTDLSSLL